jgi:hypothetical protein
MRRTIATFAFAAIAAAVPAFAEEASRPTPEADARPTVCAAYQVHAKYLADRFGEMPMFTGMVDGGIVLQLFINRATGSWTALLVRTDGVSCVTSAGDNGRQDVGL